MYRTIERDATFELIEKRSRFIGHVRPVATEDEALAFLERIRTEHAQARHNVYAYILANGRTRYSDDGEPAQTAGMPTFEVLDHAGLANVICVTTRYFGGTLLGTGGLVRAYTQAAQGAIGEAGIVAILDCRDITVTIEYTLLEPVQRFAANQGAKMLGADYADKVSLTFRCKAEESEGFTEALTELTHGRAAIEASDVFLAAF